MATVTYIPDQDMTSRAQTRSVDRMDERLATVLERVVNMKRAARTEYTF